MGLGHAFRSYGWAVFIVLGALAWVLARWAKSPKGRQTWQSWLLGLPGLGGDRKSTRLNSSHLVISYAVFCLKKKNTYVLPLLRNILPLPVIVVGDQPPTASTLTPLDCSLIRSSYVSLFHPIFALHLHSPQL